MVVLAMLIIVREIAIEKTRILRDVLKAYARIRKTLRMEINVLIFFAEFIATFMIHEPTIHASILCSVFAHESFVHMVGE